MGSVHHYIGCVHPALLDGGSHSLHHHIVAQMDVKVRGWRELEAWREWHGGRCGDVFETINFDWWFRADVMRPTRRIQSRSFDVFMH